MPKLVNDRPLYNSNGSIQEANILMISMTNNIGGGPLLKTYDNMLLPSTYNGNITVVGITSVKLTGIMHMLEWTLFFCSFWFYVC